MLKENNRLITEEKELLTLMNSFFQHNRGSRYIKKGNESLLNSINYQNVNDALENFENHASVGKIRQTF